MRLGDRIAVLWRRVAPAVMVIAAFSAWVWFGQSFGRPAQLLLDLIGLAGASVIIVLLARRRRLRTRLLAVAAGLLGAWVLVSLVQPLLGRRLHLDPDRFSRPHRVTSRDVIAHGEVWRRHAIGVALSGGGYRAAAYHAGVLYALDRLDVPITHLVTVSGGSIIGAYYAKGGDPQQFRAAVADGAFNLRRELSLGQNAVRLLLPHFSRTDVQAALVRRVCLGDLARHRSCRACPRQMIAVTDLNFAFQIGLVPEGFLVLDSSQGRQDFYTESRASFAQLDLADRVALSGAFPGAFPARPLDITVRRRSGIGYEAAAPLIRRQLALADGGIIDNTGGRLLQAASTQATDGFPPKLTGWSTEAMLVSDAGAIFGRATSPQGLEGLARAIDVISATRPSRLCGIPSDRQLYLSPSRLFPPPSKTFNAPPEQLAAPSSSPVDHEAEWFDAYGSPDPVLRALAALLTGDEGALARREVEVFIPLRAKLLPYPPQFSPAFQALVRFNRQGTSLAACEAAARSGVPPAFVPLAQSACRLRYAVRTDISRRCVTFAQTPTLRDQVGAQVARDLFDLGQEQVLAAWPRLRLALTGVPLQQRPDPRQMQGLPSDSHSAHARLPGVEAAGTHQP